MWIFTTYALRFAALLGGLLLIYVAVFLYENEQGRIQNALEDIWLKIADLQESTVSQHVAFMRIVARVTNSGLDTLLGRKLFSLRSIGVAVCYSLASVLLVDLGFSIMEHWPTGSKLILFVLILFLLAYSTLPRYINRPLILRVWFSFIIISYMLINIVGILYFTGGRFSSEMGSYFLMFAPNFYIGLAMGVACDIFFIALLRKLLRWMSEQISFSELAAVALISCLIAFVFFIGPMSPTVVKTTLEYRGAIPYDSPFPILSMIRGPARIAIMSNLFIGIIALAFVALALVMLAHRVFWPALSRPIYSLQRLGIARRGKLFGTVGSLLIVTAVGGVTWLEKVVEKLSPF
jgi:hypothetical protein